MSKTKIAFVIDTIVSPTAGTEKQLIFLLKHLDRKKFEPYLCCLQPSKWLDDEFSLCPVYVIGLNSFKNPISYYRLWKFAKFLRKENIDIIQTHFRDANISGIISGKLAGVKKIISTRRNIGYWHNWKERILLKILNRMVAKFLVNSHYSKKCTIDNEKISSKKIEVIYNFVEFERFKKNGNKMNKLKDLFGIARNHPMVTMVANLRPVKGIDIFIKSARLVLDNIPEVNFFIAGGGPERKRLEDLCNQFNLSGSIKFLGVVSDVVPLLEASDIGVLSSYSESLSNSVIEYMAAGLPVVCTDVGGNKELVQDGLNGFLVTPGDPQGLAEAIIKLINNPELRLKMGRESLLRVESLFNDNKTLTEYENLYMKLT